MFRLWRKWISWPIWWAVLVGIFGLWLAWSPEMGRREDPPMEMFHAHIHAVPAGDQVDLHVTETISLRLRQEKGIYRDIVTTYGGTRLEYEDFALVDEFGDDVYFELEERSNGDIRVIIGDDTRKTGDFTFVLSYVTRPGITGTDDYQELYLNVNGTEWPNAFRNVSARLTIDEALVPHLTGDQDCYVGPAGSTKRCELVRSGRTWEVDVGELKAYHNVTIAVGFEVGTVANPMPPYEAASLRWVGIWLTLAVGAVPLLAALVSRAVVSNLDRGEVGVVTQFTPPDGLEPVLAADFLGRPERGAAAHLAWLTVEGFAKLTGPATTGGVPGSNRDDLSASERRAMRDIELTWYRNKNMSQRMRQTSQLLFGRSDQPLKLRAHRTMSRVGEAQAYRDKQLENLWLRRSINFGPYIMVFGFIGLLVLGFVQLWRGLDGLGWYWIGASLLSFIMLAGAVHIMPVHWGLTKKGKEVRRHLMGLETFVSMSEANRISWLQNAQDAPRDEDGEIKLYEKLLPWAIVFGVERSWQQLLGDMYDRFPEAPKPAMPVLTVITDGGRQSFKEDWDYHRSRERDRMSAWSRTPDIGEGSGSKAWSEFWNSVSDASAARGSSNTSSRSSGRGWSGGGSSSRSGGSRGGGRSGGGRGGGGGGRR